MAGNNFSLTIRTACNFYLYSSLFNIPAMKKYFLPIALASLFLYACNNKSDQPVIEEDTAATASHYIWQSSLNDTSGKLEWFPSTPLDEDSLQPAAVIAAINKNNQESEYYSKVILDFVKTSGDTVYIKIPEATYLTQQMGSSGPAMFLSGVVYTLTGLSGYNFVSFDFEEGDHASPGVYSRQSFNNQ